MRIEMVDDLLGSIKEQPVVPFPFPHVYVVY